MSLISQTLFGIYNELRLRSNCEFKSNDKSKENLDLYVQSLVRIDINYLYNIYHEIWLLCDKPDIYEFGRDYFDEVVSNEGNDSDALDATSNKICSKAVYNVMCEYLKEISYCCFCSFNLMQSHIVYYNNQWCVSLLLSKSDNKPVFVISPIEHIEKLDYVSPDQYQTLFAIIGFILRFLTYHNTVDILTINTKLNYAITYSRNDRTCYSNHLCILIGEHIHHSNDVYMPQYLDEEQQENISFYADAFNFSNKDMIQFHTDQLLQDDICHILDALPLEFIPSIVSNRYCCPDSRVNSTDDFASGIITIKIPNIKYIVQSTSTHNANITDIIDTSTTLTTPTTSTTSTTSNTINTTYDESNKFFDFMKNYTDRQCQTHFYILDSSEINIYSFIHTYPSTSVFVNTTNNDPTPIINEFTNWNNENDNCTACIKTTHVEIYHIADCTLIIKNLQIITVTEKEIHEHNMKYVFVENWENVVKNCDLNMLKLLKQLKFTCFDDIAILIDKDQRAAEYLIITRYLIDMHTYCPTTNQVDNYETILKILMLQNPLVQRDLDMYGCLSTLKLD